jgi:predicted transposase/invertase (TIGR01784 family)
MKTLEYNLKNDLLFKMLFQKSEEGLKCLIAGCLEIPPESITNLRIQNPEKYGEHLADKFCRLDINMLVDGRLVDLEMQVRDGKDYPERSLFYWARDYSSALSASEDYLALPRTYVVSIINFDLFPDYGGYRSRFMALEIDRHALLTDRFNLHYYDLRKLRKDLKDCNMLERWLSLIAAETEERLTEIQKLGDKDMNQAIETYHSITASEEFRQAARMRQKTLANEKSALNQAKREGRQEGLQEGIQEGQYQEKRNIAKNMLAVGTPIDQIAMMTGLSQKDIESLKDAR